MPTASQIQQAVNRLPVDSQKLHDIVHGDANTVVSTDNGPVKSIANLQRKFELDAGDVIVQATALKNSAQGFRNEAEGFKNTASSAAASAQFAADSALALSRLYPNTTAGLGAVAEGEYFAVAGTGNTYATLYRKVSGAASEIAQYASKTAVDSAISAAITNGSLLLSDVASVTIDPRIKSFTVAGRNAVGDTLAGSVFVRDAAVDSAYVAANPLTSIIDASGAGWRLTQGFGVITVASRTAMSRLLGVYNGMVVFLSEVDREGFFLWRAGDFSGLLAADTQQGIGVQHATIAASSGAFVRLLPMPNVWHADWFGIPDDTGGGSGAVLAHTQMTAMLNLANILRPSEIWFGSKIYSLGAAVPAFAFQVALRGARGAQGTIINKRYVESDPKRGIFAFGDHGFTIDKITFRATAGSGGSGISAILTQNSPAAGRTYLIDTYVSVGNYCNYSLYVNGLTNTTSGGPSYRGLWIHGGEYFGAALASIKIEGAHHCMATGIFVTNAGGSSTVALDTGGTADAYNDDWQWSGIIGGVVNLDWFGGGNPGGTLGGRSQFVSPQIDNINVDSRAVAVQWTGPRFYGIVTNAAGAGFVTSWDGMVVARGGNSAAGWQLWGDGKIRQWGSAITSGGIVSDQSLPLAFTSSNIQYTTNSASNSGTNIATVAQVLNGSNPLTQYTIKAFDINYSSFAIGGTSAIIRWIADGQ